MTDRTDAKDTTKHITIDLAGAMEKITPEMMAVFDNSFTELFRGRLQEAETVLANLHRAITEADPEVLKCVLWMPKDISPNETVADYIAAASRRLCHPDTEFVPAPSPTQTEGE